MAVHVRGKFHVSKAIFCCCHGKLIIRNCKNQGVLLLTALIISTRLYARLSISIGHSAAHTAKTAFIFSAIIGKVQGAQKRFDLLKIPKFIKKTDDNL